MPEIALVQVLEDIPVYNAVAAVDAGERAGVQVQKVHAYVGEAALASCQACLAYQA